MKKMRIRLVILLLAICGLVTGCTGSPLPGGVTATPTGSTPATTPTISESPSAQSKFYEIGLKREWKFSGPSGEFTVAMQLSKLRYASEVANEDHPARPGYKIANSCGDIKGGLIAAGVLTVTADKTADGQITPRFKFEGFENRDLSLASLSISMVLGNQEICRRLGRYKFHGYDINVTKPLAEGQSVSYPFFLMALAFNDNQRAPDLKFTDTKRLENIVVEVQPSDAKDGNEFKLISGKKFTMADTVK